MLVQVLLGVLIGNETDRDDVGLGFAFGVGHRSQQDLGFRCVRLHRQVHRFGQAQPGDPSPPNQRRCNRIDGSTASIAARLHLLSNRVGHAAEVT